jgi:hypothetical protein
MEPCSHITQAAVSFLGKSGNFCEAMDGKQVVADVVTG